VNPISNFQELLEKDPRFSLEAYQFVREALQYAHTVLRMAEDKPSKGAISAELQGERHLTGQQLCQAIRTYALEQYGYMSKTVLNSWGIETTGHFGDIVYNLIGIGLMKKSPQDRREDFDDVYEFDSAFRDDFRIVPPQAG
jgi:uncharacterized repeat protein (TIGR04138 family)